MASTHPPVFLSENSWQNQDVQSDHLNIVRNESWMGRDSELCVKSCAGLPKERPMSMLLDYFQYHIKIVSLLQLLQLPPQLLVQLHIQGTNDFFKLKNHTFDSAYGNEFCPQVFHQPISTKWCRKIVLILIKKKFYDQSEFLLLQRHLPCRWYVSLNHAYRFYRKCA